MPNSISDFTSQVNDSIIQSYSIDFANNILKIDTRWEDKKSRTIEFTSLLAHKFENVLPSNMIF